MYGFTLSCLSIHSKWVWSRVAPSKSSVLVGGAGSVFNIEAVDTLCSASCNHNVENVQGHDDVSHARLTAKAEGRVVTWYCVCRWSA